MALYKRLILALLLVNVSVNLPGQIINTDSLHKVVFSSLPLGQRLQAAEQLTLYMARKNKLNGIEVVIRTGIELSEKTKNYNKQGFFKRDLGLAYYINGSYDSAVSYYYQALSDYEKIENDSGIASVWYLIGRYDAKTNNIKKSIDDYNKAITLFRKTQNDRGLMDALNELGTAYEDEQDSINALENYKAALEKALTLKDTIAQSYSYDFIGSLLPHNKAAEAEEYLLRGLALRKHLHDTLAIAISYINIGTLYEQIHQLDKAAEALNNCIELARKIKFLELQTAALKELSAVQEGNQDYQGALGYFKKYKYLSDSIFTDKSAKNIAELNTKYETEKKEGQIKLLNADKAHARVIIYAISGGAVLLLALVFLVYRSYRQKQAANRELDIKNRKIENAYSIIEEKNKDITDSITYAKRIQDAILPPINMVKKYLPYSFVLYNPKDIVAGDFYWMWSEATSRHSSSGDVQEHIVLIAACDCTGHGVPGAMVSVVCSNALNRAVKEFHITETGKILDKARELVLETFEKSEGEVKDGMDCSLCSINFNANQETITAEWSGAFNPLWYISGGEMKEITADKQPIGRTDNPKQFTTHKLELKKGDIIYLFTDGYADQFGGPKGKKFKYKQFQEKLLSINSLSMDEQKAELERTMKEWRGELEQIDDIHIIGIRV